MVKILWEGLASGDTARAVDLSHLPDKTTQVSGTFSSATITLQGSNVGDTVSGSSSYVTLEDPQGNDLSFTAVGIEAVTQLTKWIKPVVSGGAGSVDIDVTIMATI